MTNEYLTFRNLTVVQTVILSLYGIGFILIPEFLLDLYDLSLSPNGDFITKLLGAAFIWTAIIVWTIRNMEFSDIRKNISIGLIVGFGLSAILSVLNRFDDDTSGNSLEWLNVLLYGGFAVGYAYFTFIETGEKKSAASE